LKYSSWKYSGLAQPVEQEAVLIDFPILNEKEK
jgi:hypothetical protein